MSFSPCSHSNLSYVGSPNVPTAGYRPPSQQQLTTAAALRKGEEYPSSLIFPQPLILPGDDLAQEPGQAPQSFRSWLREKDRNPVTQDKRTIYVAAPPEIDAEVSFMRSWQYPKRSGTDSSAPRASKAPSAPQDSPAIEDIIAYLSAFFHGCPVKRLPFPTLTFTKWSSSSKSRAQPIGLATLTDLTRIRSRPSPDGVFPAQLNLKDLIDTLLPIVPSDAYALLLLVNQDMYEDDTDEFVCGRAYGASRVAVVSTARYDPLIDQEMGVGRIHAWPASHCTKYLQEMCHDGRSDVQTTENDQSSNMQKSSTVTEPGTRPTNPIDLTSSPPTPAPTSTGYTTSVIPTHQTPLRAAIISTFTTTTPSSSSPFHPTSTTISSRNKTIWLSRISKTTSHELLHCFGLDHCVYHACVMQACGSLAEDSRQPPYLCPIDLKKLCRAVVDCPPLSPAPAITPQVQGQQGGLALGTAENLEKKWTTERYIALRTICEEFSLSLPLSSSSSITSGKTRTSKTNQGGNRGNPSKQAIEKGMFTAFAAWITWMLIFMENNTGEEAERNG